MNRMVVKFDEKKVLEDELDVQTLIMKTDSICNKRNIKKETSGDYVGKVDYDFMVVIGALNRMEWFKKYIYQWIWYENSKFPIDLIERLNNPIF